VLMLTCDSKFHGVQRMLKASRMTIADLFGIGQALSMRNLSRWLWTAAILSWSVFPLAAQTAPPRNSESSQRVADSVPEQSGTLPTSRIIELVRQHPELVSSLRQAVLKRLEDAGVSPPAGDLTQEAVLEQVQRDPKLRAEVTAILEDLGYLTRADLQRLAQPSRQGEEDRQSLDDLELDRTPTDTMPADARDNRGRDLPSSRTTRTATGPRDRLVPSTSRVPEGAVPDQAPVFTRPNPYADLPSLRDLYRQLVPDRAPLARFGADVFRNGTGNQDTLPMDLPVGPDYILGPGDELNIDLWGGISQRLVRTVDRQGRVLLPEAGTVMLAGKTLGDSQRLIQDVLTPQFNNVHVGASLTRIRTVRVYVVGDVQRPGAYDLSSLSTPLNALYSAGGPNGRGSLRTVKHYRGTRLVREIDLYDFFLHGIRADVERLEPGDTLLVPPAGPEITVAGMVRRPAIYELKQEKGLADVLDLAGGVLVSASLRQINVERVQAHDRRVMMSVSLPDGADAQSLHKLLGSVGVEDGDRVTISSIPPYSDQTVYLEGHVVRPGKYPYRQGLQVADIIHSYQDLLPEPAERAEIIRLVPPDYRPSTLQVTLSEVLTTQNRVDLQPFDTIRIFGRYEGGGPKVSIYGEVLRPKEYPLQAGMTAAGLVREAGGFKGSAYTETADLASYVVQNGQKVLIQHSSVPIFLALSNPAADVPLKSGDVLTIRQLTGWKDIGASVTVDGEVLYPGTYGIEEGEKLSAVIRRAGGFRDTAYASAAVLQRDEVRRLEEKSRLELIRRIEAASGTQRVSATNAQEQTALMQTLQQQHQQVLTALRDQPVTGRMVVRLTRDIEQWENTPSDVEVRAGDVLTIPKRPNFTLVSGQVYSPAAIAYSPGKTAAWYLRQAGGTTELANKRAIFVIRANGSVVGGAESDRWWKGGVLSTRMEPGDVVVVPEKIVGGTSVWRNLLNTAQLTSSLAIAARVATSF
jgi:protein involved in polysaccharide export with SLBB domain